MTSNDSTALEQPSTPAAIQIALGAPRRAVDREVLEWRIGRIAFGAGMFIGPALVYAFVGTGALDVRLSGHAIVLLGAAWFCGLLASLVVPVVARHAMLQRPSAGSLGPIGDDLLRASLILPTVALSLWGPLTLHAPFALILGGVHGLDMWAAASMLLVGHAHIVLAVLASRRASHLVDATDEELISGTFARPLKTPRRIFWTVVIVSAIPGAIYLAVPPILTAITGLVALPLMRSVERTILTERARLR